VVSRSHEGSVRTSPRRCQLLSSLRCHRGVNTVRDPSQTLEELYEVHATALLRLAVLACGDRTVAEDVVHDAFVRRHLADPGPEPGKERAYLRRIVLNLSSNHHRTERRHTVERLPPPGHAQPADAEVLTSTVTNVVGDAVRALPARQRDCVLLHYFERLSDTETADELGISSGAVKTHLHRARAALRPMLEQLR
jgi:RNA polymerase sigma factor (sigma-70 family)